MTPADEIAALKAENARVQALYEQAQEQVTLLLGRVRDLEARLAKDSHNSSKPPSSDGLRRKPKSLRTPSGTKAGGQLGHRGQTLHLVASPDAVVAHRPAACAHCGTALQDGPVVARERRQVHELPGGAGAPGAARALPRLPAGECRDLPRRRAQPGAIRATPTRAGGLSGGSAVRALRPHATAAAE